MPATCGLSRSSWPINKHRTQFGFPSSKLVLLDNAVPIAPAVLQVQAKLACIESIAPGLL